MPNELVSKIKDDIRLMDNRPSQSNQNSNWVNFRGAWVTNMVLLFSLRVFFSVVPGISTELSLTLTNIHNMKIDYKQ